LPNSSQEEKTSSWRHIPSAIAAFSTQFSSSLKPICFFFLNRQNQHFFNKIETEIPVKSWTSDLLPFIVRGGGHRLGL